MLALRYMLNQYKTLKVLSDIAESSPKPTQYKCTAREMILHSSADWETIQHDLDQLATESLVQISKADTILVSITEKGLEKVSSLEGKPSVQNGKPITYR
jgi:hypothetical protein